MIVFLLTGLACSLAILAVSACVSAIMLAVAEMRPVVDEIPRAYARDRWRNSLRRWW